jgi:hypothetical protein
MTILLTGSTYTKEMEAAAAMLEACNLGYGGEVYPRHIANNGGKGSLVCIAPDGTRIGGLFDLADWLRKETLVPC